jgi:hypothetical protein
MVNHPNRSKSNEQSAESHGPLDGERAVLVTTVHKGVFFGYATETDGPQIKLRRARNCISWPTENKGFMGLANMGPVSGARVGPHADITLRDITAVVECSAAAVENWEKAPWVR